MTLNTLAPQNIGLTAVETTAMLQKLGFNWLDIEFVLELAPRRSFAGQIRYPRDQLQRFIDRAYWLSEAPHEEALPNAA